MCLREENSGICRIPDRDGDATRVVVVQRREVVDASPAHRLHDTFANAAMQVADELRIRLRQFAERAVEERDRDLVAVFFGDRVEPEPLELARRAPWCTIAIGSGGPRRRPISARWPSLPRCRRRRARPARPAAPPAACSSAGRTRGSVLPTPSAYTCCGRPTVPRWTASTSTRPASRRRSRCRRTVLAWMPSRSASSVALSGCVEDASS